MEIKALATPASLAFFVPSNALLTRLIRAYEIAQHEQLKNGYIWQSIAARQHSIHTALTTGSLDLLRELLAEPGKTYLYYGVDNLFPEMINELTSSEVSRQGMAADASNNLKMLAKSIDAGSVVSDSPESNLAILDRTLGVRLGFPNPFYGEFGISSSRGEISYRAIHAVYQAARLKSLTSGTDAPRVIEIGAGMGRTCYYAYKLGLRNYTIVDLPMTLTGQALFLAATIGEDHFSLPGEARAANVTLALPGNFENLGNFHLAFNSDSLPEMSYRQASRYFSLMRKQCKKFLSINHEYSAFFVRDFERPALRMPYPLRDGFFEEVYDLRSSGHKPLIVNGKMVYRRVRRRLLWRV